MDCLRHIGRSAAASNQGWAAVECAVPDSACLLVVANPWLQHATGEVGAQMRDVGTRHGDLLAARGERLNPGTA